VTPEETKFINSVAPAAQKAAARWRVPASVTIAQAILESSWGKSLLCQLACNYFGIKHNSNSVGEPYVEMQTHEFVKGSEETVPADFVRYFDAEESFSAHGYLLATKPRYTPAMKVKDDPFEFAAQLAACGYSTDPFYASKLNQLILQFRLKQYDAPELPPAAEAAATEEAA
jgi:flagellum-specific peptidoglycan hydrolase FlgJ